MKTKLQNAFAALVLPALAALSLQLSAARAQVTAFTYQGRLNASDAPANGRYDFEFALFDAATNGNQIAPAVTNAAVDVTNGLFATAIDFGNVFNGSNYWLAIAVSTNGADNFTELRPRQPVTPAPDAIFANTASNVLGTISPGQLSGAISTAQLPASVVTNGASGVNISGTFSGNGAGVTNLNSANLTGAISDSLLSDNVALLHLPGSNSLPFTVAQSPGVGGQPSSVTAADVNGDGRVDLISANLVADTLTVLTNNGSGQFTVAQSPDVRGLSFTSPDSVTAADVNDDGRVDLISANRNDGTLTVFTNDGSGQFTAAQSPGVGNYPISVTAADVNGDGKVDLICANESDNLTVLTNNGNGQFTVAQSPGVGNYPSSVAAADVNGDGKVDLISANASDNTLTVLTNNGNGQFTVAQSPGVGNYPISVTAADVNGDGEVDLISANPGADTLTVLTNNGSGQFAVVQSPGVGSSPISVTAADVNGDGKVDLISANANGNTLSVLLGNDAGNVPAFGANQTFSGANAFTNTGNVFAGNGSGLTGLNASQITGGTLNAAQLPASVALLDANQTFTGQNIFSQSLTATNTVSAGGISLYQNNLPASLAIRNAGGALAELGVAVKSGNYSDDAISNDVVLRASLGGSQKLILQTGIGSGAIIISNGVTTVQGTFNNNSDRNVKEDFTSVTPAQILDKVAQLPLSEWSYKVDAGTRHIGPMAQDFYSAFDVGTDDKHIAPIDEGGVALAAIQGLNEKVEAGSQASESRIQKLETENAKLKRQNDLLEKRLNELTAAVKSLAHNE